MEVDYIEICGSKIKAFEFKWNPKKKSRVTKAFTNRYPDAEVETITPENFGVFLIHSPIDVILLTFILCIFELC